jgi:hypothetical protein
MVYAKGPYNTKLADAGSADYTTIVISLTHSLTLVLGIVVLVVVEPVVVVDFGAKGFEVDCGEGFIAPVEV